MRLHVSFPDLCNELSESINELSESIRGTVSDVSACVTDSSKAFPPDQPTGATAVTGVMRLSISLKVQTCGSGRHGGTTGIGLRGMIGTESHLLLVAVVLGVLVWLVMRRTQIGIVAQAVIMNEELAQALGINTRLVRFVTFCLGAGLASLAGALITPLVSVHPNVGVPWLINAFMLVLVAGVSLGNLALAALILGGAQVLVSSYGNPVLGSLTIVILAVVILRFHTITT
jgi:branched-subunit amino acid ABC-type transport system permease component